MNRQFKSELSVLRQKIIEQNPTFAQSLNSFKKNSKNLLVEYLWLRSCYLKRTIVDRIITSMFAPPSPLKFTAEHASLFKDDRVLKLANSAFYSREETRAIDFMNINRY